MTVDVHPAEGWQPDPEPADEPSGGVSPDSPLAGLRARRVEALQHLYVDLKVPRWDDDGGPAVYVRYQPVDPETAQKAVRKRQQAKPRPDKHLLLATCDVLLGACIGVFAVEGESAEGGDPVRLSLREGDERGEWTKFDGDLAEALGIDHRRATDIVRGLYLTEGDIWAASQALAEWSGIAVPQADDAFLGN